MVTEMVKQYTIENAVQDIKKALTRHGYEDFDNYEIQPVISDDEKWYCFDVFFEGRMIMGIQKPTLREAVEYVIGRI